MDFWISKWISGFQSGFLDFKADFWISKWISRGISGFQANFWISKRISGFHLNRYYSKIQLKYTHDSSTAFLSACMLTDSLVPRPIFRMGQGTRLANRIQSHSTSPLHSAQAACSLIVIHIEATIYSRTDIFSDRRLQKL